ncbi:MAG: amino acid ABC transporter substrate-binding protein [Acidimicrobiia bacterium]|nr:amino acid ABC transporter substrate-binding protein [Acidimicrobiia bacterium]
MLKKLAVLFAVLALVAAACGGSDDAEETTTTVAEGSGGESEGGGETGQEGGSTLSAVQARGNLICGVSGSAVGFSETQADGSATGFDADYCRAVAAAVLGDANAVEFRALTAAERFEALKNNEIDVLIRNTTWTQSRDTDIGIQFTATTYFDGQQIMGDPASLTGLTPSSGFEAIDGATVCTNAGTTTEKNITEGAAVAGVTITLETVETFPEAMEKFKAGTCDLVTTDGSGLYGNRAAETAAGTPGAENWVIFPEAPISKEPLGPAVRQGDDQWFDVIQWTVFATFIADENGVTSANIDTDKDNTPELTRLFGGEGEIQTKMGLPADAFYQTVKQVGNYGEIYDKNLTGPLGLAREGSFNMQWFDGGLIYAPPAR